MKDSLGIKLLDMRIRAVLPHLKGRALDIGCGTNELMKAYGSDKGVGVDVHPWEGCDLVVEDTAKLPYKDGEFDTIAIIAALNHIPNRAEVLKEASRVTKKNGRLVMTMIPPGISRIWHVLRSPWDVDQTERGMIEGEVYGLTNRQITKLLKDAGFEISERHRFMLGVNCVTVATKA